MSSNIDGGVQATDAQGSNESVQQESQPQGQGQETGRGPSPWAKDLDELGLDQDHAQVVDQYLASKWQPRMTQLEQQYAPYKDKFQDPADIDSAADLLYSLRENPQETYKLIGEIINESYAENQSTDTQVEPEQQQAEQQSAPEQPAIPDKYQKLLDEIEQEREARANEEAFQKVLQEKQQDLPGLDEKWFAKLIVANNGDVDAAIEDFKEAFPDKTKAPEPPAPVSGEGTTSPQTEEEEYDGDFEKLMRSVVRKANTRR